jgi:PPOX class probable FMN-dependent enzyme
MIAGMIDSKESLRALYPAAKPGSLKKQLSFLDEHCLSFIGLSPFVVLASGSQEGQMDASPRGGAPGFVKAPDSHTLLIPDAPGNNRLDTLENIIGTGRLGLLFLIPGVDETLRVNGRARLSEESSLVEQFKNEKRTPRLVIEVKVEDAYLHCAKALMRSNLWSPESRVERSVLPTMGQMLKDQTGSQTPPETREQMLERYKADL